MATIALLRSPRCLALWAFVLAPIEAQWKDKLMASNSERTQQTVTLPGNKFTIEVGSSKKSTPVGPQLLRFWIIGFGILASLKLLSLIF
jgi:hypothetical protein